MKRSTVALLAAVLAGTTPTARAEKLTGQDLDRRTVHRRAVAAVTWGMSAVNHELMLRKMLTKTKEEVNQFIYWSLPADWRNRTLTLNPTLHLSLTLRDQ